MSSYNRVIIMGNLTRDPELKQLSSGQSVCRLGLASNRQFKNRQNGQMVQEVCFVDVDVWGPQADTSFKYLQKGRGVLIEGRLKLDTWQSDDGQKHSKHSIVADRVTFLAAQGQENAEADSDYSAEPVAAKPARSVAPKATKTPSYAANKHDSGEISFKDEEPFVDELPF